MDGLWEGVEVVGEEVSYGITVVVGMGVSFMTEEDGLVLGLLVNGTPDGGDVSGALDGAKVFGTGIQEGLVEGSSVEEASAVGSKVVLTLK